MSKLLNPLGQSMASLFTPESERLAASRKTQGNSQGAKAAGVRIPGMPGITSHKSGDSLGNPNSPGYEPWGKKKGGEAEATKADGSPAAPGGKVIETASQGPEVIRLSAGWEKLLLAQKKLCEKAKGLFTMLEGPVKYSTQKRGRLLDQKSRGCIVDLDIQETAEQKHEEARLQKESGKKAG